MNHPAARLTASYSAVIMQTVDYSGSERMPRLMEMVSALSRARQPIEVLQTFSKHWIRLQGASPYISLSTRGLNPGEYRITRALMIDELSKRLPEDVWSDAHRLPVHTEGLLGQVVREGRPVLVHNLYLKDDPVLGDQLSDYGTMMAVPLFDDGQPLNWAINFAEPPDAFSVTELEETLLRSNLVGGTVRHVRTAQQLREANAWISSEIKRIADIQFALLPKNLPQIPGMSLAASYQTFDSAGGDMYFIHPMGIDPTQPQLTADGRWGFMIGDVAGHGPAAAVVMAMVESLIGAYHAQAVSPAHLFGYLNSHLCAKRIEQTFVTAWAGVCDPGRRQFEYAVAGHPPPLRRRRSDNGSADITEMSMPSGGLPLGILPDETYKNHVMQIDPGDTVLLYTDGIPETRAPDGRFFGADGLRRALLDCNGDAQCTIDTINKRLREHAAGDRPQDDQTLLAVHVMP